jgi:hypothetical protein
MQGNVLAETSHFVNILPPVDITGGAKSQAFSMKNHGHATILFQIGVSAGAPTAIFVKYGTATAAVGSDVAGSTAMAFSIYKQETAGAANDILGARTAVTSAGYVPSANDGIMYVIEVDAREIPDGNPYLQLVVTNAAQSVIASAVAILSGARFSGASQATVTT